MKPAVRDNEKGYCEAVNQIVLKSFYPDGLLKSVLTDEEAIGLILEVASMMRKGFRKVKFIWDKVFKNGPSKICGRQPLKNFTWSILEYFVPYVTVKI